VPSVPRAAERPTRALDTQQSEWLTVLAFIRRQVRQIDRHGRAVFVAKLRLALVEGPLQAVGLVLAAPVVATLRLLRPWVLIRFGGVTGHHLGHLASDTELYLCERDAGWNRPARPHRDVFFFIGPTVANRQLATMWRRVLTFWPRWLAASVVRVNGLVPGGGPHQVPDTDAAADRHNLLGRSPAHLRFTRGEEARGLEGLQAMGLPPGSRHVCLAVRDPAYAAAHAPLVDGSYQDYRNADIRAFRLAAAALADRGYWVIRMGARVAGPLGLPHPRVLDYATNGTRSDFMDVYLGATCAFCLSTSTGFDAIPLIFRRPIAVTNGVPLGHVRRFTTPFLSIAKHHMSTRTDRELSLPEILAAGAGFDRPLDGDEAEAYRAAGIRLVDNTPEEIRDLALEMAERVEGTWRPAAEDEELQRRFFDAFRTNAGVGGLGRAPDSASRGRIGAAFLRQHRWWLE
jgi:putative glycosyltransferase (TIGR04372 family)